MSKTISIHSFLRGVGKSHIVANVASVLAAQGKRVAVLDMNIYAPTLNLLFGLGSLDVKNSLTDYLFGRCTLDSAAYDITSSLGAKQKGKLYVVPAEGRSGESALLLRKGFTVEQLGEGAHQLARALNLDVLLIDNGAGVNQETMISIAIADSLGVVLRLDKKDYQGTSLVLEIAKELSVPHASLIVNQAPSDYDLSEVKTKVIKAYHSDVAAVLPYSSELATLASDALFVVKYPNHALTKLFKQVGEKLM
ncbi:MAG: P-loop NTPase [Chloroflexi bacterium]|nr:P-loop NTPase [Chloroflexota bacterium]MBI5350639.1 P-loop NTPase [Chloroflexota bacterium]MBI5713129.1 P-loop NTPase [Chloroflexota bacterium]